MHPLTTKRGRRSFLVQALGAVSAAACSSSSPASGGACAEAASGPGLGYCLVARQLVRVYGAARMSAGEVLIMLLDDNTGAIVARDGAGFYAMSATCTHACCNVTVCAGASCSSPILTAAACTKPTPVVLVAGGGPAFLCPCHGSQYSADGNVLNGPATRRLPSVALRLEGDDVLVDMSNAADPGARVVG